MKKDRQNNNLLIIGLIALILIVIFNLNAVSGIDKKIDNLMEEAEPAELELITLTATCQGCPDITPITSIVKDSSSVVVKGEKSLDGTSETGKALIKKYGITKLPTLILSGEISRVSFSGFKTIDNVLVYDNLMPPYMDAVSNEIKGKVKLITLKQDSCTKCADVDAVSDNLKASNVFIDKEEELSSTSAKGKELIKQLNIKKLPALLISQEIEEYPIVEQIEKAGLLFKDGYYLVEGGVPYYDLETSKTRGLVDLTLLTDDSCEDCYDVSLHKIIFANIGLFIDGENTIDIGSIEGKKLVEKYKLVNVPTVFLSGDMDAYDGFKEDLWGKVGTIENDGNYVFRNIELLGPEILYKNLATGEIVKPIPAVNGANIQQ
jgi:hypothetical protein